MACEDLFYETKQVTILNGEALSDAIDVRDVTRMSIFMPAAWDAADIGFQVSNDPGGTYVPANDDAGALLDISSPAVDEAYAVPLPVTEQFAFVRLWSQTAGADTNQTADRTLTVLLRKLQA